ncbi:MAG TPA: radical SAM protein [Bdellovibrionota bacterium]|nr:radical SAM protein [Bdellovibrionota bacterium]
MRVLLLTPPMTQLNTPYPATAYLTGFLRSRGLDAVQADPALELVLRLFSRAGLERVVAELQAGKSEKAPPAVASFLAQSRRYLETAPAAIRFLQGKDPSLALRIVSREFLPEGPRFAAAFAEFSQLATGDEGDPLSWAFGALGLQDRAKYLASLLLDDLADVIREGIDSRFGLSRYGEKLAASQPSFDPLHRALQGSTLVDRMLEEIARELVTEHGPALVGFSVPFPGNVYGAFRMARAIREASPGTKIALGGGYVNTELRELKEPRVFDHVDFVTLDDGELPLLRILEHLSGARPASELRRTLVREGGAVVMKDDASAGEIRHRDTPAPCYDGLPLDRYLSILEMLNPMHRIWSDGRWNKLTVAHGCYWKKCGFCDITLDYIGRYDTAPAASLVDRMETVMKSTGQSGFHFVDEALPPAGLRALAEELLARGLQVTWWGNVRFEKAFTPELALLLARSGCVAVSGGLEVASDRLLKLMNKGVSVEQVARVTQAFTAAGIMVHAYLMYGFPTQTEQETVDSLERVRQLFESGCIQSAYWHRFSATVHSPIGRRPDKYGISLKPAEASTFARNDLAFEDPTPCDHDALGPGLRKALYNYMHGVGIDSDVRFWFAPLRVPKAKVPRDLVARALSDPKSEAGRSAGSVD